MNTLHDAVTLLEKGDWEAAHTIVQADNSATSAWAHGIAHMLEGDLRNARYWYGRAERELAVDTQIDDEIATLKASIANDAESSSVY